MSLGSVNKQTADSFGYRLITSSGDVVSLAQNELSKYRADETDEMVARAFRTQTQNIADRGLHPLVVMPAKAGALIVASYGSEAEKILDAVYGVPELDRASRRAPRPIESTAGLKEKVLFSFGFAASGQFEALPLGDDFKAAAVGKPANVASAPVISAPVIDETMRLAA